MIRLRFRVGPAVGLLAALVLAPAPDLLARAADLPPVESVRMLREARLAHRRGDVEAELAKLRAAAERFPGEITVVRALLEYHRDHGLPEAEERRLRILLRERLADEETLPSFADLRRIALDPDTGDDLLREIDRHVASRLSGPEGAGEGRSTSSGCSPRSACASGGTGRPPPPWRASGSAAATPRWPGSCCICAFGSTTSKGRSS